MRGAVVSGILPRDNFIEIRDSSGYDEPMEDSDGEDMEDDEDDIEDSEEESE